MCEADGDGRRRRRSAGFRDIFKGAREWVCTHRRGLLLDPRLELVLLVIQFLHQVTHRDVACVPVRKGCWEPVGGESQERGAKLENELDPVFLVSAKQRDEVPTDAGDLDALRSHPRTRGGCGGSG